MSRNGKYIIWFDTETTGLENSVDQIIQAGLVVEDSEGNIVEEIERKVRLKDGVIPSAVALTKNKLNPFSKKWTAEAITEYQLAQEINELAKKYNTSVMAAQLASKEVPDTSSREYERGKPIVAAYNSPFDKGFAAITLARSGFKLSGATSKSWLNPMATVKKMIAAGKLQTELTQYGKGSAAQTAVAAALGIEYEGTGAHTALSDAKVMRQIQKTLFKQATGFEMNEVYTDPSDLEPGQVYHLITDSASSGVKKRHIHVLKNDPDKAQIIALDEDDIKKHGELRDSAIRTFNYDTIVGEIDKDVQSETSLNACVKTRKDEIGVWFKAAEAKFKKAPNTEVFDEDTKNFNLIEGISARMVKASDKRKELTDCYTDLLAKFNGDRVSAKTVLTKAERLAQAKGLKGWSNEIYPEKTVPVLMHDDGESFLKVALHPSGEFKVGLDYKKDGEIYNLTQPCKTAKDIKKLLEDKDIDSSKFAEFLDALPNKSDFKDPKHPSVMIEDLKKALDYIKANPEEVEVRNAVGGVLKLLKKDAPGIYKNFKDIEAGDFDENYWMANQESSQPHSPMTAEQARLEHGGVPADHLKPGDKAGKTPCALCGRPLSAEISRSFSMGPTCRAKAEAVDTSAEPIEAFVEDMMPYKDLKKPLRPGEIAALKYERADGKSQTIFSETLAVFDDHIRVLNRREFQKSLKAGYNPAMCVVLNTIKIPTDKISGVGRIDPEKISNINNKGVA